MKNIAFTLFLASFLFISSTSKADVSSPVTCIPPEVSSETTECKKYTIQIDNNFSDEDASRIREGIADWRSVIRNKFLYTNQFHCALTNEKSACVFKIIKQRTPEGKNGFYSGVRNDFNLPISAIVSIRPDMHDENVSKIILHEFGHVLGLDHSTNDSSVMFHVSKNLTFSCEDKINVCLIWKCDPKCQN